MMIYSFPILILGIVGILNQVVDKIIFPFLFTDQNEARVQLGIYGAAVKGNGYDHVYASFPICL